MGLLSPQLTTGRRQVRQRRQGFYRYLKAAALPSSPIRPPPDEIFGHFSFYRRILNEQYSDQQHPEHPLPDCQKADRQDHLYRACPFQRDRKRDDGGQNQAYAPRGSPAECNFFVNLMKKSLTIRLWQDPKVDSGELRRTFGSLRY